jgi:GntR family transcriptional regulator, rspAB operon transcriptional repressor
VAPSLVFFPFLQQADMQATLLSQRVYDEIYEAMLANRLGPGDRLNRRQVAADLGVSVAPVLEAMTQLEWEGFLETKPRRGTVVKRITARHALGRFRLRQAIEAEAARLYAGRVILSEQATLLKLAQRLDASKRGSLANWRMEVEFHDQLVRLADCPVLHETFTHVMRHSLYHAAHKLLPQIPHRGQDVHSILIEALAAATPARADTLIREHLACWITALEQATAKEPADADEPISYQRGQTVSLKQD